MVARRVQHLAAEFQEGRMMHPDVARHLLERQNKEHGIYTSCQHFLDQLKDGVLCARNGQRPSCMHCDVCPKCSGRTRNDKELLDEYDSHKVWIVYRVCAYCGNQTPGVKMSEKIEIAEQRPGRLVCSVQECGRGVYGHHAYKGHPICSTHNDQIYTWRRLQLPQERFPLQVVAGVSDTLRENPEYRGRRRVKE